MKLVVIESPFGGDVERNLTYLRRCMADCFKHGEAPYASHGLYTQPGVLDDTIPEERKLGMEAGFLWGAQCAERVVYADYGITRGMREGIERGDKLGQRIDVRTIGRNGE